jgi:hypothetical protein
MKNAVLCDMMSRVVLVGADVSEQHITSIIKVKDSESPWFSTRIFLMTDGEERHREVHSHCKPMGFTVFHPEDGGDLFHRNIGSCNNYTASSYLDDSFLQAKSYFDN